MLIENCEQLWLNALYKVISEISCWKRKVIILLQKDRLNALFKINLNIWDLKWDLWLFFIYFSTHNYIWSDPNKAAPKKAEICTKSEDKYSVQKLTGNTNRTKNKSPLWLATHTFSIIQHSGLKYRVGGTVNQKEGSEGPNSPNF